MVDALDENLVLVTSVNLTYVSKVKIQPLIFWDDAQHVFVDDFVRNVDGTLN